MSADDVFAIVSVIDLLDDIDASNRDEVVERLSEAGERLREVVAMIEVGDAEAQKVVPLGVAPATVEGSESSGAVVDAQADGDHAVVGTAPGVTLNAGQLIKALQQWEPESPVYLDILGDLIDIAEVHPFNSCGGGIRIVGAEVVERQAVVTAAHRRAIARLRARYADEYQALYEDELANPPEPGRRP